VILLVMRRRAGTRSPEAAAEPTEAPAGEAPAAEATATDTPPADAPTQPEENA